MSKNRLKIKLLSPDVRLPVYATPDSACFDIYANTDAYPHKVDKQALIYGTGLIFEIPKGKVLKLYSRSGHGFKDGVRLCNGTGIIDSDYRDEVKVGLRFDAGIVTPYKKGERICQGMIEDAPQYDFDVVDELSTTQRVGGFGSTGA